MHIFILFHNLEIMLLWIIVASNSFQTTMNSNFMGIEYQGYAFAHPDLFNIKQ